MNEIWETVKFFIASHKAASIAVASVVGVTAVGAGGYGIYNLVHDDKPAEQVVEVVEEAGTNDVEIPEFVNVKLTSESLEKDLTIYISDENDNPITGVPFQVKLLSQEDAESLQSYVDAIKDIDAQIAEYTQGYDFSSQTESAEGESEETQPAEESKKESKESTEESAESAEQKPAVPSSTEQIMKILQDRNIDITVTDENGEVVETQKSKISNDPLYLLFLDKQTAVQAYTVALNEAQGTVLSDDDQDGVIEQKDLEPGDYMLAIVNDVDSGISYEPATYTTAANVKDKVEFKVQKEITKKIKKDVASEDGQKKEAPVPVEETLKDTVEFVESKKVENGSSVKSTKDVVAPKLDATKSKATKKGDGLTSVTHKKAATTTEEKFTIRYLAQLQDADGKNVGDPQKLHEESLASGATPQYKPDKTVISKDGVDYKLTSSPTYAAVTKAADYTFVYKSEKKTEDKKDDENKNNNSGENNNQQPAEETFNVKLIGKCGDETTELGTKEGVKVGDTISAPTWEGHTASDSSKKIDSKVDSVTFTYTKNEEQQNPETTDTGMRIRANGAVAVSYNRRPMVFASRAIRTATANTDTETATLDMTYKDGVFTINASANVTDVKVNGTAITIKDKKGTFTAPKDGDYKLTGTPVWSDKTPATDKEKLYVTYTVSGMGAGSTAVLKDKEGNELYVDEACTKKATVADYAKDKTYYYKAPTYTYYGWQSIDGNTFYFDKNGNKVTGTQVIQGVQYDFGTDGVLVVKGTGIDVSKYQGNIDWKAAKSAVSFAIIRCGYRGMYDGQLHEDPYFYKNMSGAKSAGVNVGIYIYSTALNEGEAVQEASMAVAMAQKAGGCSYPIFLDMEDTVRGQSGLSTAQRMAIVNAFVTTVQSSGYKAGLYCSKNWMTGRMDAGAVPSSCSIWIAQYNTSCTYSGRKNIWQYSSKGSVPGIKGHVDMNKSF